MEPKSARLWDRIAKERQTAFDQLRQGQVKPSQFFALVLYSVLAVGSLGLQFFWIFSIVGLWLVVVAARIVLWSIQKIFKVLSRQDWKAIWERIAGGQGIPTPSPITMSERRDTAPPANPSEAAKKPEKRSA